MSVTPPHIPTGLPSGAFGLTIPITGTTTFLMVAVWFVLVPICILVIRFGSQPTLTGLHRQVAIRHAEWWWFSTHKYGLIFAIGMALAGAIVAIVVSRRFQRFGAFVLRHYDGSNT